MAKDSKNNRKEVTQKQTNEPWGPAQGPIKFGLGETQNLYNQGPASYFPDNTYAGLGDTTNQALESWKATAAQPNPTIPAMGQIGRIVSGEHSLDASPYADIYARTQGPLGGRDQLEATARGDYLGENNPYLQQLYASGADDISNRTKSLYSGMGRYGSAPMQNELTDSLGNFRASVYAPAYEAERGRQLSAAGQLGSQDMSQIGLQMGAAGAQTGVQNQNIGNQMAAAGMIPGLNDAQYAGADRLLSAGMISDADRQTQIDADKARFDYGQNSQQDLLNWYNAQVMGGGQMGGTSTVEEPKTPFWQKAVGYVMNNAGQAARLL